MLPRAGAAPAFDDMIGVIRQLSARAEFGLVVLGAFGYMVLGNVLSLLYAPGESIITNESLRSLVVFELAALALLLPFLYLRGWRLSRISPALESSDFGIAVILASIAWGASMLATFVALVIETNTGSTSASFAIAELRAIDVLAVSAVNPVFEELILCGYVATVLKERRGFWTAVNVSLVIRLSTHLYQGAVGVVSIIPIGFVFAYWYARTGRLWPVILAHAAFDVLGLWPYVSHVG